MAKKFTATVLAGFLQLPAKNIVASRIDFAKSSLKEYKDRYAIVLDNVLTLDECNTLIDSAEAAALDGWERARVNLGAGRERLDTWQRDCGRMIWDSQELATKIWKRIEQVPEIQEIVRLEKRPLVTGKGPSARGDVWAFSRPRERMRVLKYIGGEYFRPHRDGCHSEDAERSWFTMHIYLNGNDNKPMSADRLAAMAEVERERHANLIGGATVFHRSEYDNDENDLSVYPKAGRILVFQQRDLVHSGDDVVQGHKYTIRTDLMYRLET